MEQVIINQGNHKIAHLISDEVLMNTVSEALDVMANLGYQGIHSIIIHQKNLPPAFFELETGLAGDILQKFANYRMKLAIIGDFENVTRNSLKAFIIECNRGKLAFFVPDKATAITKLTS